MDSGKSMGIRLLNIVYTCQALDLSKIGCHKRHVLYEKVFSADDKSLNKQILSFRQPTLYAYVGCVSRIILEWIVLIELTCHKRHVT